MLHLFEYDFVLRACIAGMTISIIAPLMGMFLVVRRYSLLADTLAHVSLLGVALSVLCGVNPMAGALVVAGGAALGIEKLRATRRFFGESILALFLSGSLATAVVVLSLTRGKQVNILSYLFGSITTVTWNDVWLIGCVGALVAGGVLLFFQRFFVISYDEDVARASGVPVEKLNILLMVLAAVTISLALRIVGTLLVGALMVIPVLTAVQYGKSFATTTIWAVVCSMISVALGLAASLYVNVPSGGAIVVVSLVGFIGSTVLRRK